MTVVSYRGKTSPLNSDVTLMTAIKEDLKNKPEDLKRVLDLINQLEKYVIQVCKKMTHLKKDEDEPAKVILREIFTKVTTWRKYFIIRHLEQFFSTPRNHNSNFDYIYSFLIETNKVQHLTLSNHSDHTFEMMSKILSLNTFELYSLLSSWDQNVEDLIDRVSKIKNIKYLIIYIDNKHNLQQLESNLPFHSFYIEKKKLKLRSFDFKQSVYKITLVRDQDRINLKPPTIIQLAPIKITCKYVNPPIQINENQNNQNNQNNNQNNQNNDDNNNNNDNGKLLNVDIGKLFPTTSTTSKVDSLITSFTNLSVIGSECYDKNARAHWYWSDQESHWNEFTKEESKRIEKGFLLDKMRKQLDDCRWIDYNRRVQRVYDDESLVFPIKRTISK
ncbi:hypothetical protein DFA_03306 [Cavenderia fasciculata]|uniref:WWE domain-containing protein n=1 Tax=Cavenderia fasciculata TaxID=261658 RepID=F4PH76_CACFS|nr:uncharacterized protein DFA_03306 [Cavenderia fasciculata]EGG25060.1 hypothetical protein DFA_03306 [Cavenderia fasciculata]|eukprot:XP_004362911.1 hypothetical protein DFA_03306 [Cavenderia fasciculata]